ncbi:MAG: hypothetical protein HOV97_13820, partial [Nonomuraea sp.]|nr:hypothetical protein [Nonomuraea sp.]
MEIGGPPETVLQLSGNVNADEELDMLGMMGHSDHPYTEPMLRFLAEHHPAARVSAAARVTLQAWRGVRPPAVGARRPRKPRKPGKTVGARKKGRH